MVDGCSNRAGVDVTRLVIGLMMTSASAGGVLAPAHAQQPMSAPSSTSAMIAPAVAPARAAVALVFDRVNVVDVRTGKVRRAQRVVVVGNRIRAVGDARVITVPSDAQVVDGRGKYLIPGLWDMHVHAFGNANPYTPFLLHGVTGVREMGTAQPLDSIHRWRREIVAGTRMGPRIIASGPYLEADSTNGKMAAVVKTRADAHRVVDSLHTAGADFIKVHFNYNSVTPEVFFAILAEARRVGLPVVGHQAQSVSMADASDSGQRTFEHTLFMYTPCWTSDPAGERACAAEMGHLVRNKSWITPTLGGLGAGDTMPRQPGWEANYVPDSNSTSMHGATKDGLWFVRKLRRGGVGFLAASDGITGRQIEGGVPDSVAASEPPGAFLGAGVLHEMELLAEAGLTPLEVLQTATLNPAKYLEATDSLGSIARHKVADLVFLDANPLVDVANLEKIRAVVADGRYFDRTALDSLAARVKREFWGRR